MKLALCTLVLNEMEWLPKLYEQHKNWPDMVRWVFVESADDVYAASNPEMVSLRGLSVDGTTEWLDELAKSDDRIVHIKHGFSHNNDPAQGKCESRNQYLRSIDEVEPDCFMVVDADEFYTDYAQQKINFLLDHRPGYTSFIFKHRDIWRPASIVTEPLFQFEVIGGFWDIPYCRGWRWFRNLTYSTNHNTPEYNGRMLDRQQLRFDKMKDAPEFVHMGFASDHKIRAAKNKYYAARGEKIDPKRRWYVISRDAFETWNPGNFMPYNSKIIEYTGPIPECFSDIT